MASVSHSHSPLRQQQQQTARQQSTRKARSPTKMRHDSTALAHAALADLTTLLEDFSLERELRMRATRNAQADRLEALERRTRDQLAALDERVARMTVREFFERYAADEARAAREAVEAAVTHKPMIDQETVGRSRKRAAPSSPVRTRRAQSVDPLGTTKKARPAPAPASSSRPLRVPSSSRRARAPQAKAVASPSPDASDWDLMDRNEASRVEEHEHGNQGRRPPTQATFTYEHPDAGELNDAYFRRLQENLVKQMRDTLDGAAGKAMSRQERAKLEKRLADMTRML